MKKGQVTIFIIIGLVILLIIGLALYFSARETERELELVQPRLAELPAKIEPVRQAIAGCIERLGKDAIVRLGSQGGYVDDQFLRSNPVFPTQGDAVEFTPTSGPKVAYWWHMSSPDNCESGCEFESMRPNLRREDGPNSMELQVDNYVNSLLSDCMANTEVPGCNVQELDEPYIQSNIIPRSVYFQGKWPFQVTCEDQTARIDEHYVVTDVNLKDMYDLATNITNHQLSHNFLEAASMNIMGTYSRIDRNSIPPFRGLEFSGPSPGEFWVLFEIKERLKNLFTSHYPLIQVFGTRDYTPITAEGTERDPELYELVYNRQFLIPLNRTYSSIAARFSYLPQWDPYLDLNCNGQLCRSDSGTNYELFPFSVNRYEFAYDLSFPVLVELRDPEAFGGEGYTFQFFLEHNMRNSQPFTSETQLQPSFRGLEIPSIFCNPEQHTSGMVDLFVRDGETRLGLGNVSVAYVCGEEHCNLGTTGKDGKFKSRYPRCIGGTLILSKAPEYITSATPLTTSTDENRQISRTIEPRRKLIARLKNYALLKPSKYDEWRYVEARGLTRPKSFQETVVVLTKILGEREEPFATVAKLQGPSAGVIDIVPGNYTVQIVSMLKGNFTIPKDNRCTSYKVFGSSKEECYDIPQEPIEFSEEQPLPVGVNDFEYEITSDMLRGATHIEFRHFMLGYDGIKEEDRVVEDLGGIEKTQFYSASIPDKLKPVLS